MPQKGYKSITVREEVWDLLNTIAEKENRTIPSALENVTKTYLKKLEGGEPAA